MTASEIQLALMSWAHTTPSDIIVPNYYVGRWEMDVCKVTKLGQMTEYEIKVSKADYKKEWEKKYTPYSGFMLPPKPDVTKHGQIQAGKRCNRFYFVCPEGLIQPAEVPKGYGLIWVKKIETDCMSLQVVKRSSLWTKQPQPVEVFIHLAINISIKYCNARIKILRIQEGARRNKTKEV